MINKNFLYAVIGANNDPDKFGYKVFRDLLDNGYKVIPVNPNEQLVHFLKCYSSVADYEGKIDVAIFVTKPEVSESLLQEVKDKGIKKLWFQPGASNQACADFCATNNLECVREACIMMKRQESQG